MKKTLSNLWVFVFIIFTACNTRDYKTKQANDSTQNIGSSQVQKVWLQANKEKMVGIFRSQGFNVQDTGGQSQIRVAKYIRHGKGVSVVFVDKNDNLPTIACATYLLPTNKEGTSWRIAGDYIAAFSNNGKMKTVTFEKFIGENAPNVSFELDEYLSTKGVKREKSPLEALPF